MFYQTRSNAIILQGTLPAHCIVKVERLKNGEKLYERQYLSPRPPPKISLKHDLNWNKGNDQGSTVEHQPVGKLVQQSLGEALQPGSSKPTQFPVKGMYPAPHIHEHFTIHKWLRQTAYILTHNLNKLEHIANNGMNTTMHTDANIAQF